MDVKIIFFRCVFCFGLGQKKKKPVVSLNWWKISGVDPVVVLHLIKPSVVTL